MHERRSIRLHGYDYTQPGYYFVTICTANRQCLFGQIIEGKMQLNRSGKLICWHWKRIPKHFHDVCLDEHVVMPNHLHGIIRIVGAKHSNNAVAYYQENLDSNASPLRVPIRPAGTQPQSLAAVIQNFKSITTRKINRILRTPGSTIWQRNYYEHVIRNEESLNRIREYIIYNPARWMHDRENPDGVPDL